MGGTADGVELRVADDGVGFDAARHAAAGHIGLRLVTNAVEEAGGTVLLATAPGAGTTVVVTLPHIDR